MDSQSIPTTRVAVIGAGPAGLMAAEVLSLGGMAVDVYEAMPSAGRKFLMAGKGGLNLTHSEPMPAFLVRYGSRQPQLAPLLLRFGPAQLRQWASELGFETFVGSSGRVFPQGMKAATLLRAWLLRLKASGVTFHMRHRWLGWAPNGDLRFATQDGESLVRPAATILALGGASWPRLGSTGAWVSLLGERGVPIAPLKPANCGFDVGWTDYFRQRYAGAPLKSIVLRFDPGVGPAFQQQGEFVITEHGVEGSLIYAASARLRDAIERDGKAVIHLDLLPNRTRDDVAQRLSRPRGSRSLASHLEKTVGIHGVKAGLLREFVAKEDFADPARLAAVLKALPVPLIAPRPIEEAISTAGGVRFEALDKNLMLRDLPGVFCAGEMLDWEAQTGGYLLTACFSLGRAAGEGALQWLRR